VIQEKLLARRLLKSASVTRSVSNGSANGAEVTASKLLTNPKVAALVQAYKKDRSDRLEITADKVLQEIARLGFFDVRKLFTDQGDLVLPKDMDDQTAAAIQSIEVVTRAGTNRVERIHKIKLVDKRASLEMLVRHLGLYKKDNAQSNMEGTSIRIVFVDP